MITTQQIADAEWGRPLSPDEIAEREQDLKDQQLIERYERDKEQAMDLCPSCQGCGHGVVPEQICHACGGDGQCLQELPFK